MTDNDPNLLSDSELPGMWEKADFIDTRDESPYPTQAEMNAEDAQEYYRLAAWLSKNRENTRLAGEPVIDWAIRLLSATPKTKAPSKPKTEAEWDEWMRSR